MEVMTLLEVTDNIAVVTAGAGTGQSWEEMAQVSSRCHQDGCFPILLTPVATEEVDHSSVHRFQFIFLLF